MGRPASLCTQVCSKREKRLADPTLEKYVLSVVLDTISAFFSSPFSENSTSLQVSIAARRHPAWRGAQHLCFHLLVVHKGYTRVLSTLVTHSPKLPVSDSKHITVITFYKEHFGLRTVLRAASSTQGRWHASHSGQQSRARRESDSELSGTVVSLTG